MNCKGLFFLNVPAFFPQGSTGAAYEISDISRLADKPHDPPCQKNTPQWYHLICFHLYGLFSGNEKQKSSKIDCPATDRAINPWKYPHTYGIIQITTARVRGKNYGIYKSA